MEKKKRENLKTINGKKKDEVLAQARKVLTLDYFNKEFGAISEKFDNVKNTAKMIYSQKLDLQKEIKSSLSVNSLLKRKTQNPEDLLELRQKEKILRQYRKEILNNGSFLMQLVFGSVHDVILEGGQEQRYKFKHDYETLKLNFTIINVILTFIVYYVSNSNFFDTLFRLFFFYYYVTLYLREDVLKSNGSTINKWWFIHHLWSIVISIVSLSWPPTELFLHFRKNFFYLNLVNCGVQIFQYYYQTKRLYVMKSMGKAKDLDVIGESVQTTQRVYLAIIIPFIIVDNFLIGYFALELLYECWKLGFGNSEWQAMVVGAVFVFLSLGNLYSLFSVVMKKFKKKKQKKKE